MKIESESQCKIYNRGTINPRKMPLLSSNLSAFFLRAVPVSSFKKGPINFNRKQITTFSEGCILSTKVRHLIINIMFYLNNTN